MAAESDWCVQYQQDGYSKGAHIPEDYSGKRIGFLKYIFQIIVGNISWPHLVCHNS